MAKNYSLQASEFVERLKPLGSDSKRAQRAALGKYWSETTRYYALPVLGSLYALDNRVKTTVAALFALHPNHVDGSSFGATCLRIAGGNREAFDAHFRRLLSCSTLSELELRLVRIVRRAGRAQVPIDYVRLFRDLDSWLFRANDIKTKWAMDYWQTPISKDEI